MDEVISLTDEHYACQVGPIVRLFAIPEEEFDQETDVECRAFEDYTPLCVFEADAGAQRHFSNRKTRIRPLYSLVKRCSPVCPEQVCGHCHISVLAFDEQLGNRFIISFYGLRIVIR